MKNFTLALAVLALLFGVARYSVAEANPDLDRVSMKTATVADLEKAGDEARAQKDFTLAMRYYRSALNKDGKNAPVYNKLGLVQLQLGDLSGARSNFQRAARYDSKWGVPLNNLGAVDLQEKKTGSAARYFKKAIALEETNATFHVNLGSAWLGQSKVDRAIVEFTRALELDPEVLNKTSRTGTQVQNSTMEDRAKFQYLMARVFASRGDIDQCLQCLKKAKENGYRDLAHVYKDEQFARLWQDQRLAEIVAPPAK